MLAPTEARSSSRSARRAPAVTLAALGLGLFALLAGACSSSTSSGTPIKEAGIVCAQPRDIPSVPGKPPPPTVPTRPPTGKVVTKDIKAGTGAVAVKGRQITVQYYVISCGTGKQVYSTWDNAPATAAASASTTAPQAPAGPTKFILKTPDVIPGWIVGMAGMKAGGLRSMLIPADLIMGTQGGAMPGGGTAGPNDTLIFMMQLDAVGAAPVATTTTTAPATTATTVAGSTTTTTAPASTTTTAATSTTTTTTPATTTTTAGK